MSSPEPPAPGPGPVDKMHEGTLALQDRFGTRRMGERVAASVRDHLIEREIAMVREQGWFFLATADPTGTPDCSFRAGPEGFVRVLDERTLAFEDYDGNGAFMSLGNLQLNPRLALLFIDFARARRLRVAGEAELLTGDEAAGLVPGATRVVRIHITHAHPNCSRHIPQLGPVAAPRARLKKIYSWVMVRLGEHERLVRLRDAVRDGLHRRGLR